MCREGNGVSKSIIMKATWKLRCSAAPDCHKGDFRATVEQAVIHRKRVREGKLLLVCQMWGKENGGLKGKDGN